MVTKHHRKTSSTESLFLAGLELLTLMPEEDITAFESNDLSPSDPSLESSDMSYSTNSNDDDYEYSDDEEDLDENSQENLVVAEGMYDQIPKKRRFTKSLTKEDLEEALNRLIDSYPCCGTKTLDKDDCKRDNDKKMIKQKISENNKSLYEKV